MSSKILLRENRGVYLEWHLDDRKSSPYVSPKLPISSEKWWTATLMKSLADFWVLQLELRSSKANSRKTDYKIYCCPQSTPGSDYIVNLSKDINQIIQIKLDIDEDELRPIATPMICSTTPKCLRIEIEFLVTAEKTIKCRKCEDAKTPLMDYLPSLFISKELQDVVLKVKDEDVQAHKLVLVANSRHFESIFINTDMNQCSTDIIHIDDLEPEAVREALRFMYTGIVPEKLSPELSVEVYRASHKFAVQKLKDSCSVFLSDGLNEINALDILLLADQCEDEELKDKALTYILSNPSCMSNSEKSESIVQQSPRLFPFLMRRMSCANVTQKLDLINDNKLIDQVSKIQLSSSNNSKLPLTRY